MKFKSINKKLLLVSTISCVISLFSVGFSSFVIKPRIETKQEIIAGSIIDLTSIIERQSINSFTYCPDGFVYDETISSSTTLNAQIILNINEAKAKLSNYQNHIKIETILESSQTKFLEYVLPESLRVSVSNAEITNSTSSFTDNLVISSFEVGNISSTIDNLYLNLSYQVNCKNFIKTDFKTDIFPVFQEGLQISLETRILYEKEN